MSDRRFAPHHPVHSGPRPTRILAIAAIALCTSCSPSDASEVDAANDRSEGSAQQSVETDILNLIAAVTPAAATLPPGEKSAWFGRRYDTLERMRAASHEHGLEALLQYQTRKDTLPEIRSGLLDIAAHAASEETRSILALLVTEYGDNMLVRTKAAELLGDTAPDLALEVLGPILRHEKTGRTYPREEHMLRAWHAASITLNVDPVPMLCTVAVDLPREMDVRHLATKLLGEIESDQGRQALEQLLTESSGNHMLRRFATQSLQSSMAPDAFCALIRPVFQNEVDINFQAFLDSVIMASCR